MLTGLFRILSKSVRRQRLRESSSDARSLRDMMVLDKPYRRIMSENAGGPPLGDAMMGG